MTVTIMITDEDKTLNHPFYNFEELATATEFTSLSKIAFKVEYE